MGAKDLAEKNLLTIQRCFFRHCKRKLIWWQMLCVSERVVAGTRRVDYESRIR